MFIQSRRCPTIKSDTLAAPVKQYARKMMSHLLFQIIRNLCTPLLLLVKFHVCISDTSKFLHCRALNNFDELINTVKRFLKHNRQSCWNGRVVTPRFWGAGLWVIWRGRGGLWV